MDDDNDDRSRQDHWAEQRTDWSEDRTILANERTFAAWIRTGVASLAVAIGLQAVFSDAEPRWAAKATATIFIVGAIVIFGAATRRSVRAQRRIDSHATASQPSRRMIALAVFLTVGSVAVGVILWLI